MMVPGRFQQSIAEATLLTRLSWSQWECHTGDEIGDEAHQMLSLLNRRNASKK
jgi:hypothetical protein